PGRCHAPGHVRRPRRRQVALRAARPGRAAVKRTGSSAGRPCRCTARAGPWSLRGPAVAHVEAPAQRPQRAAEVLHRALRARSRTERARAGAPEPDLVASAVAATFAGVLADWLHGLIEATPADVAHRVWRLLITLHRTPLP